MTSKFSTAAAEYLRNYVEQAKSIMSGGFRLPKVSRKIIYPTAAAMLDSRR
jgi:hypothetical protein